MLQISFEEFEKIVDEIVEKARKEIPEELLCMLGNLSILVQDKSLFKEDKNPDLSPLGIYYGISINDLFVGYSGTDNVIVIYRIPHLNKCKNMDDLRVEIYDTLLHEIGHHFGLKDDKVHELVP